MILEDEYNLIYAENGREAMELIRANCDKLSLVLLDLMMPVMDGFAVMEQMRGDEQLKTIPIIVLTAEKSAELRALQMGAADFITKPFDMHEVILARVSRIIELSEGRQLISAAEHDPLTVLYSRNFFFEYADRIFRFHPDWKMDANVINIEKLHSVNAINGREFGDDVLRLLGDEIRVFLGETEGIASRIEADRFDIYCLHLDDYQGLLDRFQRKVDELSVKANVRLRMGVNPWREDLDQRLLNDLRLAVEKRQLCVFYQPKYNIQFDPPKLSSAEALIRWKHPELGMISPGSFIPLFESNGQIGVVDSFVWQEAARQVAEWRDKFDVTIPVSVNVSRAALFDPNLSAQLNALVRENGLAHSALKLEVTESAYTDNADQMLEVVKGLKDSGFESEMDDFGSGYSSLNMISTMPIDVLKMDMKFIRNIETNEKDFRLVQLVLDIARYLRMPVVAEGVENATQLEMLREAKCELVQGYYFSRPLPPEDFE